MASLAAVRAANRQYNRRVTGVGEREAAHHDRFAAALEPASMPPTAPDQVFFGLTRGASLGPPIARPVK